MTENKYLSWDEYFMKLAELSAQRSKDPKTKVGATIIDPRTKHILGIGYNGLPLGMDDSTFNWAEVDGFDKNPYVVHAEANAILNSNENIEGSTIYVTMFPCPECAKLMAQKRVSAVVFKEEKFRLKDSGRISEKILNSAGIKIIKYLGEN